MENQQHQLKKDHQDKNKESKSNEFTKTNPFGQGLNGEDPNANAEKERKGGKNANKTQKTIVYQQDQNKEPDINNEANTIENKQN